MPKFTYSGLDKEGKKVEKMVEAVDRFAVYDIARSVGHTVDQINSGRKFSFRKLLSMERINALLSRIKTDELVMMTRNLGSMLTAGLPLSRALSVIERQSKNPRLRVIISEVNAKIEQGDAFNEALTLYPKVFNDLYVSMVRAGEEGGTLSEALHTLGMQMERSANLKKKIKGAMIYPSIVITIMVGIAVLMMIYVMPTLTSTFEDMHVDLPTTTKVLIAVSNFMVAHTLFVLLGMIGGAIGFMYFLRTTPGKKIFHLLVIYLPIVGEMVKETNAARTARTLSSLLHSGVDVIRSLEITEDVLQNIYYKPIIREAAAKVEKGTALSETFVVHSKLYPVLVGEMIMVGEETGQIAEMLEQLATFYENEVERKTKDLSTIIEPLLMVVIGGSVGFFALAMIAPIYSISDSIG